MNEVERNPVVMENASEIPAAEIPNQPESELAFNIIYNYTVTITLCNLEI